MIGPQDRNRFESELMLQTVAKLFSAVLYNRPIALGHTSRWRHHLHLLSIVMSVIAVESWIHGLSEQAGFRFPEKFPARKPGKFVYPTLELKVKHLLAESKKNLKYFKLRRSERSQVLREVNNSCTLVLRSITLRNQLAHGKTFLPFLAQ